MKNLHSLLLRNSFNLKLLCFAILILINNSCEKENNPEPDFEFRTNEIVWYPDRQISMTFEIIPSSDLGPYIFKWFNPDSLKDKGPYTINISSNVILDFVISDANDLSQRFTYEIEIDTLDSLKYDFRNKIIGTYNCEVTSLYDGITKNYQDTLKVIKSSSFNMLNILTSSDIKNNYEGNRMTYLGFNGNINSTEAFYGYHCGVSFSNDSIHYSFSGPLGHYYTNVYDGILIDQ